NKREGCEDGRDERSHFVNASATAEHDDSQLDGADVLLELEVLVGRQKMCEAGEDRALDELPILQARPSHAADRADRGQAEVVGKLNGQRFIDENAQYRRGSHRPSRAPQRPGRGTLK